MPFNPQDPYDAAALYNVWLSCSSCPAHFDYVPQVKPGLEYYHQMGQRARKGGWAVLPGQPRPGRSPTFTVLCPQCAARLGVSGCDAVLLPESDAIRALSRELEIASQKAG